MAKKNETKIENVVLEFEVSNEIAGDKELIEKEFIKKSVIKGNLTIFHCTVLRGVAYCRGQFEVTE